MDQISIEGFDSEELEETLFVVTEILKEVGTLPKGAEMPTLLMSFEWGGEEWDGEKADHPDWPRALVRAIAGHWREVTEAQAAAVLLKRLTHLRPHHLGEALAASSEDQGGASTFARTMNKVSPEFAKALEADKAGHADIALRMLLTKVYNIDPSDPSDAFFVDATVYAYEEIFEASASDAIKEILTSMVGMPEGAIGFALILAGTNGIHEIWLEEPEEEVFDSVARMAAHATDSSDEDLEAIKKDPNAIAAAATLLSASDLPPHIFAQMLGAVAKLLDIQGMLITSDPRGGCRHEILDHGSFHAVRGSDLLGLRHKLMNLPSVDRFRELAELYEETSESFNDRLVRIAAQVEDDMG